MGIVGNDCWGLGEVVGVFWDGFIVFRGDLEVCWCVLNSLIKRFDCCALAEELLGYDLIM